MTNPFYGIAGLRGVAEEKLKRSCRLPLFIAIDAFMNETTALADYIVPDTHNFESWGFSARGPVWPVKPPPRVGQLSDPATSRPLTANRSAMEAFCIAVAKAHWSTRIWRQTGHRPARQSLSVKPRGRLLPAARGQYCFYGQNSCGGGTAGRDMR